MTDIVSPTPVPIDARRIWDMAGVLSADGPFPGEEPDLRGEIHPDLIRYKGAWYCGLKEGNQPGGLGRMRIIRSLDGQTWESVRVFQWSDRAMGDAKFSVTGEGALMLSTFMAPLQSGEKSPVYHASVTWLTDDGVNWGQAYACPAGVNRILYSPTWHRGVGYCIAYGDGGTLFRTLDGKCWEPVVNNMFASWRPPEVSEALLRSVDVHDIHQQGGMAPREPNEAALAFDPTDGRAIAIARTHPFFAILGTAPGPDYTDWTWRATDVDWDGDGQRQPSSIMLGVQMGGPLLKYLSNGLLLAAGRADASTPGRPRGRLTLFIVDTEAGSLRRWGDFDGYSHYPGIVEHEGQLWITCGRQQGFDPFEVYLLKVPMPKPMS